METRDTRDQDDVLLRKTFVRNEIRYYADGRRVHLEGCDSIGGCWLTPDGERITPWKCNCSNKDM